VRPNELRCGHRLELAASAMEDEVDVREGLEPRTEPRHRLPYAFRHGADAAVLLGIEVEHAIGLSEPDRPEHDGFRAVRPSSHASTSLGVTSGRNGLATFLVVSGMRRIRIYTTRWCGFCVRAKTLLESRGLPYEEVSLDDDPAFRQTVYEATGGWTVPQILVDEQPIGGYTELWRLDREGRLDDLLAA
jgi:glutaredoxin 3